jgi:hypothetical protein
MRSRIAELGLPIAPIDAGQELLQDPARWFDGPVKVVACGRAQ